MYADVPCPHCGAEVGEPCVSTRTGWHDGLVHAARRQRGERRERAVRNVTDPFTDVPCPECRAASGVPCDPDALGRSAAAHPRRVDRALRARLDRTLGGSKRATA